MAVISLLLIGIVFSALAVVTLLFAVALDRPQAAAMRLILAQWKFKSLAYIIPFSPALSYLVLRTQFRGGFVLAVNAPLVLIVTSISSAALAATWLCIPDDPARRIRARYAILLSIILWLLDLTAGAFVHEMTA